ncbi:hypothetical protein DFH08DRAFT_948092 [Mycena albidolilacea]|uniref:Uncharacterized protein n=1 Tax=Mycena albidolilacea TaxID=1033008 RepID=A0AAD7ARA9_9AGAR|nr:hypothetical protein DFH08DRAFT_948092 [Mycena albidolilacea]
MSVSVQKPKFSVIGIHQAPAGVSKCDFDAKVDNFVNSFVTLPAVQKNFLSYNVIFQNNVLDASLKYLGMPPAQPCVVLKAEFETEDNFMDYSRDPAVGKLLSDANQFGFMSGSIVSSVDLVTRIDVPAEAERRLWVGIYRVPGITSAAQFQDKVGPVIDAFIEHPLSQARMLKHTMWLPNSSSAPGLQSQGYPAVDPAVVIMVEYEICAEAELQAILAKADNDFDFHVNSICFGADVVKKI